MVVVAEAKQHRPSGLSRKDGACKTGAREHADVKGRKVDHEKRFSLRGMEPDGTGTAFAAPIVVRIHQRASRWQAGVTHTAE